METQLLTSWPKPWGKALPEPTLKSPGTKVSARSMKPAQQARSCPVPMGNPRGLRKGQLLLSLHWKPARRSALGRFASTSGRSVCGSSDSCHITCTSIKLESVPSWISLLQPLFLARCNFFVVLASTSFLLAEPPGGRGLFLFHPPSCCSCATPGLRFSASVQWWCTGPGDEARQSACPPLTQVSSSHATDPCPRCQPCPAKSVKAEVDASENQPHVAKSFGILTGMWDSASTK